MSEPVSRLTEASRLTEVSRLVADARAGDEQSFLALYHAHRTALFRFAWRMTGSTAAAEDIVQECFLALLKGASFQAQQGSLRGYLFGITRNLAMQRMRASVRESLESDETDGAPGPLEDVLSSERAEAVSRTIAELAPLQREALILFEYEEMTLEQIAEITGVEIGAVKARLHRARESLRRRLAPLFASRTERSCS